LSLPEEPEAPERHAFLLRGDVGHLYWHLLHRAAGYPDLGVTWNTGKRPDLGLWGGSDGGLWHRGAFATRHHPEETLISIDSSDDEIAQKGVESGLIDDADRRFMTDARSKAVKLSLRNLRALTDIETRVFDDACRCRIHWLAGKHEQGARDPSPSA
jgi:hypothetical protein